MKISLLAITVAVIGLTGCQAQMHQSNTSTPAPLNYGTVCFDDLRTKPELSAIAGKVALGRLGQQTFALFGDTTKPTDEEKAAILVWVNARQACYQLARQWQIETNMPPHFVAMNENSWSNSILMIADLYNGKMTYGEYARARAEAGSKFQQQWAAEVQRLQEHQAAAEEQRRDLALMYLLNQPKPVPVQAPVLAPMPIPRSTYTNCQVIGNFMNCTTR